MKQYMYCSVPIIPCGYSTKEIDFKSPLGDKCIISQGPLWQHILCARFKDCVQLSEYLDLE